MISNTATYALRILGHLAEHADVWTQGEQIARATGVPANYLAKILNQLRKRGLVLSQKGWGGGFRLAAGAGRTAIAVVVEIFDGEHQGGRCLFGLGDCDRDAPCALHTHWERISAGISEMLGAVTIADLKTGRGTPRRREPA